MTALVGYIFSSGGVIVVLGACVAWFAIRPASRRARRFLLTATVFYVLVSTYAVTHNASRLLLVGLRPFEASDVPPGPTAIVVLGSGSFTARDWAGSKFSIVDPSAATRVLEAVRVFRLINQAWVISSGGTLDPNDPDEPTGLTMRDALVQLGVPDTRVLVETKSGNTHDEAVIVAPLLASMGIRHTVLVTSDYHMRRSLGAFKAQGVDAVPAIARPRDTHLSWYDWVLPSSLGLYEGAVVAHEALGLVYYTARGWSHF